MSNSPIVHVEIPANDPQSAGKFYSELFGWKLQFDETFNYLQFQAEGGPGGAFVKVGEGPGYQPGKPVLYVGTDDIDASLAKAKSLGGTTIVPKTEIPGMGWFAIFADPTGNQIGLYTGSGQQG